MIAEIAAWEREAGDRAWSYYGCWLAARERFLVERGVCGRAEINARTARFRARPAGHDH